MSIESVDEARWWIRVGVGDLMPVIEEGVRGWLRRDRRTVPVGTSAGADVVVLDPLVRGSRVLTAYEKPVVAFCPPQEQEVVAAVLAAGAYAFVPQNGHRQALMAAIVAAARTRTPHAGQPVPRLSHRERTALLWWLRSMTKASVARRMGVSPHTVDMYIKRIRAKYAALGLHLPTKADLLVRALADGLVEAEDLVAG
ncbi:helix-turn-helix transcriptional regulator [Micromonospora carbonacea]|uniref:DNA-binding transcriptional regulator, CsgD family n=1 Tax=Micromonospora carbonacea TaxID=47853 RepID=A0A1C5AZD6_9ACTN|nr:helix-turn-helix transcriptional regulator [Micromonospora carbonacea]SCF50441.1 DNA-binding transcriptional regulator, CsgD family [Micromonospora carbonacea]